MFRQEQFTKIGKCPFFANSAKLLQLSVFHSAPAMFLSQLLVNSGSGKGINFLCVKRIRQSSQIAAPIQLVNGLRYTAASHSSAMKTALFSVHKMCKFFVFFK